MLEYKNNRGFKYGDCLFETIKIEKGKVMLLDYHFDRLEKSMNFLQFDKPKNFSKKYIKNILLENLSFEKNYRVRLNIFRDSAGLYSPDNNNIDFLIDYKEINDTSYFQNKENRIDIYKKLKIHISPLSNLKTNNRLINVMAGLDVKNNSTLHNLLLINDYDNIVEAINGNVFFIKGKNIFTPKLTDGCIDGVMRRFILDKVPNITECSINKEEVKIFDEIFITNAIQGVSSISHYIEKKVKHSKTKEVFKLLRK